MFNVTAQKNFNNLIFDGFYYQLFQAITYLIHKCAFLQDLFLRWCNLNKRHKFLMHYFSYYVLDKDQLDLYAPIMHSLHCWDTTQDKEEDIIFQALTRYSKTSRLR